ncbi:MAG: HIT family protein [Deltaproteobacteria bacterium]|nr:HIT family protein [Deltaproteobacteria bacterium]
MACIFCRIERGELPSSRVFEDERFLAFMDIHPWRPGHVLVVPRRHAARVAELPEGEAEALFALGLRLAAAIRASELPCADLHFVLNDGKGANQSVPHVHLHLIPRQRRDFLKLAGAVISRPLVPLGRPAAREVLDAQAEQIRAALQAR